MNSTLFCGVQGRPDRHWLTTLAMELGDSGVWRQDVAVSLIEFVLGGARSGKTRHALERAAESGLRKIYIATGTAFDDEMRTRIARHVVERGPDWSTIEEPLELPAILAREAAPDRMLLVDCLTLWLNNLMYAERDPEAATDALCATLRISAGPIILVSNEIGLGLVPDNALARAFRDAQGRLNQAIAREATRVVFIAAGLPLVLKAPTAGWVAE